MFKIAKIHPETGTAKYLDFNEFIFPAGEISVKLNARDYGYQALNLPNTIIARIQNSDDLFKLAALKDAVARFDTNPVNLFLPYVPYARQDRVCDKGESFTLVLLARFIASMGFNKITIVDPHSNVTPSVFEAQNNMGKLQIITQLDVLNKFTNFIPTLMAGVLVSPDAGANKKTADVAGWLQHASFVRADKLRDLTNGQIKEIAVYADDLKGKNAIIVDDLCEFGGTFLGLAKELRKKNCGKIILFVTHGVFGGGKREVALATISKLLTGGINMIYTTNSYHEVVPIDESGNFHVLDLVGKFYDKI